MNLVEIDLIVEDSAKAFHLYQKIFDVKKIEGNDFIKGQNEVVFDLFGVRFHMLDANPDFGMIAPSSDHTNSIWFNITVPQLEVTFQKAISHGCVVIQEIIDMPNMKAKTGMFKDSFGYVWQLHEVYGEVSYEERVKSLVEQGFELKKK